MKRISNFGDGNSYFLSGDCEWTWDEKYSTSTIKLSHDKLQVTFHPLYSEGTAVVRGVKPMEQMRHHFWEIAIITFLYGTDIMIGVGTERADVNNVGEIFCSIIGQDSESWGFSYKGYVQHNGKVHKYGHGFTQDNVIGVHLDTWKGTLQFFVNRKPLGIAFTKLSNVPLYPLISSTMAKCVMKLIYSCSMPVSLQSACLVALPSIDREILSKKYPGIYKTYHHALMDILHAEHESNDCDEYCKDSVILDEYDYALVGLAKRTKRNNNIFEYLLECNDT